ncbi:hypothetical protein BOX37_13420 [Nocardia mangyaensis]|uniref:Low molecular weight antigen MTB12-like C-terminal domain-containing protein n=1 Tax=Nocardia mangyaensis TaxID=2213200 RepID=A0A1J0VRV5_9NOCA|nr:hypothetical protein [Nocardia mangyaensis]APE34779.1 hypothetical protein BOX37_13420 [Nocardia mangyaensis]
MNFRSAVRALTLGILIIAAATLTACASGDDEAALPTTTTKAGANCPAVPSTADIDALVSKAVDPNTPVAELLAMVQGMEDVDPGPIEQARQRNSASLTDLGMTWKVDKIVDNCGTASAEGKLAVNNQPGVPLTVPIVYDNDSWKIEKSTVCSLIIQGSGQIATGGDVDQDQALTLAGC